MNIQPDRGGMTVFRGSSSHQPPRQVNGVVRASISGASFMKHTVDEDLKSICDEIAAMKLSPEEWLRQDKKTFWRASCVCGFNAHLPGGGAFLFQVRGVRDQMCYADPLTLTEILSISQGQLGEIDVQPPYWKHPEDEGMRRVEVDPEVVYNAINDAINVFVREVLVPRGLVNPEAYFNDSDLLVLRNRIAKHWAEHWKVSWKNDDASDASVVPPK
jgi:hypothetical protein